MVQTFLIIGQTKQTKAKQAILVTFAANFKTHDDF